MKTYTEKEAKLEIEVRNKLLEALSRSEYGQAIREELVDLITEISDVGTIPLEILQGNTERLTCEIVGRNSGSKYLKDLYKILTPREEKKTIIKQHK